MKMERKLKSALASSARGCGSRIPFAPPQENAMWTILEACENLNATETALFQRANRLFANGRSLPTKDVELYKEHGIIPKYVSDFLDYHEKRQAVG